MSVDGSLPGFIERLKYRPLMVPIADSYANVVDGSPRAKAVQRRDDGCRLHTFAEFDIDLPCLHETVASNDELRGNGKKTGLIAVIFFQIESAPGSVSGGVAL